MFSKTPFDLGNENGSPILDARVLSDLCQKLEDHLVRQDARHLGVELATVGIFAGGQDLPYQVGDLSWVFPICTFHLK